MYDYIAKWKLLFTRYLSPLPNHLDNEESRSSRQQTVFKGSDSSEMGEQSQVAWFPRNKKKFSGNFTWKQAECGRALGTLKIFEMGQAWETSARN